MLVNREKLIRDVQEGRWITDRGTRQDLQVRIAETIDGQGVDLPLIIIAGRQPGPRLWVHSAVHGDEVNCISAVLECVRNLDPAQLVGTLIAVPVLNIVGFRSFQREAPFDGADMNRIWDKDPHGLGYTKVFSYIWVQRTLELIRAIRPSWVVDLHDGGVALRIMSHVLFAAQARMYTPEIERVAWATGMEVVWEHEGVFFGGSTTAQMHALQIPAMIIESGGMGHIVQEDVQEMVTGLHNLMHALGMLPGPPVPRPGGQRLIRRGNWVRCEHGGLFMPAVQLGQLVHKGDAIGRIHTLFDNPVETILAPVDGIVFGLRHFAVANVGDYICNVGEIVQVS